MSAARFLEVYARATPRERMEGMTWYPMARALIEDMARGAGVTRETAAGVVAALSPRSRWTANLQAASLTLAGCRPAGIARFVERAAAIARGNAAPAAALRGPKVRAFYRALCGDNRAAVVDVWILRAAGFPHDKPTPRQYARVARSLRHAARAVGLETAEFQAIVWVRIRNQNTAGAFKGLSA